MELKNKDNSLNTPVVMTNKEQFQLSIFDAHTETFEAIRKELSAIDINHLTPVEALMKLQAIKERLH
jgi:DNA mismatch repair protein MutS